MNANMDTVTESQIRRFRNTLTGAVVSIDLIAEDGELDCKTGAAAEKSHWPAAWAISFMRSNGGLSRWVEEV